MNKYKLGKDFYPYDMALIDDLYNERIYGMPLSFYLLDLRKTKAYCHLSSNILAYFMKEAVRVEGEINLIEGNDKRHSWVEKENFVYDTIMGVMWKKTSFYEKYQPTNISVYSKEKIQEEINIYLKYDGNIYERYLAWIQDILDNLDKCPYREILKDHIKRFVKEKKLEEQKINEFLIDGYKNELYKMYKRIEDFINDSKLENVNNKK